MRLFWEQKMGQSSHELVLSVFLSFFLHAAVVVLALIFTTLVTPKVHVPTIYDVKLVGRPAEVAQAPASAQPSAPPRVEPAPVKAKPQPQPKIARVAPKPVVRPLNKGDMPELSAKKSKPERHEPAQPAKTEQARRVAPEQASPRGPATASTAPAAAPAGTGIKADGVGQVTPTSGDSPQMASYSQIIRDSIGRNWNPTAKGMEAKVLFKVLRTGRVYGDVNIEVSSGNAYFDMAAKRAILSSSPFPPLPDDFYKQYAEFTVVLQEKD
jgi:TonB family protein